jgi:hypothetical protein
MNPAPAGEEPEQGRGQPFVPLFSVRRVLVVVFNPWRGIEPDPERRGEAPMGILENHDPRGLSMRRCGGSSLELPVGRSLKPVADHPARIILCGRMAR